MESASNSGTRVGYTRVSTVAQTLDQQNTALWQSATTSIMATPRRSASRWPASPFFSTGSDATNRRPPSPGVTLISTTDGIDSSTAAGRMVIGVLASMAEFERELIKERTALKRAVSRANGTKFGRRTKVADPVHIATAKRMKTDGHTARDVAKYLGVSRATLYRYLADDAA